MRCDCSRQWICGFRFRSSLSFPTDIPRKSQSWQSFKAGDRTRVKGWASTPTLFFPNLCFMSTYREEMWPFHRNHKETKRSLVKFISPSGKTGKKRSRLSGNVSPSLLLCLKHGLDSSGSMSQTSHHLSPLSWGQLISQKEKPPSREQASKFLVFCLS